VRFLLYALAAAAAGVLAGGVGALLLEGRTRSWRDARDAELTLRAPVLGVIPDYSSVRED
jgi:capsular polysaccharide biosynthesis protein